LESVYEEENFNMVVNCLEIITEMKVRKEVDKTMQFMARVDYEETLEEKTPEEMLMDYTVPVVQKRPNLKIKFKIIQEKKNDKEHTKEQKAEKKAQRGQFVLMGHDRIKGTKFYGPWVL
jgi:hypothetical protein